MGASRVVIINSPGAFAASGTPDPAVVARMLSRGLALLTGENAGARAAASLFRSGDRVGIKVNTIGGRAISTRPEVAPALADWLAENGLEERNVVIWDRTTRELREAGYATGSGRPGARVIGTDADGVGYGNGLVTHLEIGSLFSRILTEYTTASISLAILKDHGLAGLTGGMKNYFGAIHNPNKYHDDHCDPHVAEVFDAPPVKARHRLTVLDGVCSAEGRRGVVEGCTLGSPCLSTSDRSLVEARQILLHSNAVPSDKLRPMDGLPQFLQSSGFVVPTQQMGLFSSPLGEVKEVPTCSGRDRRERLRPRSRARER